MQRVRQLTQFVSAISGIAAVLGRPTGIVLWGIEDNTGRP